MLMKRKLNGISSLWIALFLYRTVLNPLLLQTFFSPDEYYQSLQVAYHHVFNTSAPLTWEWTIDGPIRGYLHVLPFMILYWLLRLSSLDQLYPAMLVLAPKMLQGCIQFIADVYLYKLCTLLFPYKLRRSGHSVALYALLCQTANWFTFYCGARTFGNSMETTVSVVGLYYYYLYSYNGNQIHSLWKRWWPWLFFAGLGVVVRPTNALFWVPVAVHALLKNINMKRNDGKRILWKNILDILVIGILPIVLFWIIISIAIDSVFYGRIVFVMWNFIKFNVIENRAHAYGVQPWHWYFSQGLPVMLLTMLPLVIGSLWYARRNGRQGDLPYPVLPLVLIAFLCGTYSLFAHKEFRFIFPILPLCMMYCGHGLAHLQRIWEQRGNMFKLTIVFILLTNVAAIGYFCLVHLRAPIDVMQLLHKRTLANNETLSAQSIQFWMPCHHVPGNSHMHNSKVNLHMLDCSPDFSGDKNHIDEADRFFSDPGQFIRENVHSIPPPDYVVMYERLALENDDVRDYLIRNHYARIARLFHCHFPEILDRRMSTHVLIYQRSPPDQIQVEMK